MNRLVLIDGNAILHRAYHALPLSLTNQKGEPTNAVYGFVSILLRVIEELKPTHVSVAFDRPGGTFRNELYKEYQAQRPQMEDSFISQISKVHRVVEALDIPIYEKDGFEADDVIGTIAEEAIKNNIDEVVIVTGDRDLLQLVNHKVKLFMPVKGLAEGKLYGEKEAEERMGVKPEYIVDLKALMGDSSDNYPGVAGIGPKTAINLITSYGHLDNIYKHLGVIENNSVKEKLEQDKENAYISHKLAMVVTDVSLDIDIEKTKLHEDLLTQKVTEVFGELGFKTLLKRLSSMTKKETVQENKKKENKEQMSLF